MKLIVSKTEHALFKRIFVGKCSFKFANSVSIYRAQDTYNVLMHEVVDGMPVEERKLRKISYYQW
jgi:hypothetical protein